MKEASGNSTTIPTQSQKFTFTLEELNNNGKWILKENRTNNGSSIVFSNFKVTIVDQGVHYYRIRELDYNIPANVNRDTKEYIVKVDVGVGVNISGNTVSTTKTETYWYINNDGMSADDLIESYEATVYDLDNMGHLKSNGSGGYLTKTVDRYRIKSKYLSSATSNQEGTTSSSSADVIKFVNTNDTPGSMTFNARKILKGKKLTAGAYEFELVDSNGQVLETATNDADGNVTFDYTANYNLSQLTDGTATFTYTIREKLDVTVANAGYMTATLRL